MLKKLFESLDETIFTDELKESLETQFNEAVESKAQLLADERIDEEIEKLSEKSEEYVDMLSGKSEEHIDYLTEKADQFVAKKETEMLESLDQYLDRVVEEFVESATDSLNESVKSEKADLIIEAFDSMLVATGVKVSQIVEAKDTSSDEHKLAESIEKYDSLVETVIAMEKENEQLIQMGVIAELTEGLSLVESAKFKRLAGLVNFEKNAAYSDKLETIRESVIGRTSKHDEQEPTKRMVEHKKDDTSDSEPAWAHLV